MTMTFFLKVVPLRGSLWPGERVTERGGVQAQGTEHHNNAPSSHPFTPRVKTLRPSTHPTPHPASVLLTPRDKILSEPCPLNGDEEDKAPVKRLLSWTPANTEGTRAIPPSVSFSSARQSYSACNQSKANFKTYPALAWNHQAFSKSRKQKKSWL